MHMSKSQNAESDSPDAKDTTAARLLKTAATLFREKGYAHSTTRELATLLGIQKASLYYHIDKKEDLLYALCVDALVRIQEETERAVAQQTTPLERLRALIHAHLCAALNDQDKHATMLVELRELSGERRLEVLKLRDRYETFIREMIQEGQEAGVLRREPEAKYQGLALLNLLNWTIFWFRPGGELTPDQLAAILTSLFLQGAALTPSDPILQSGEPHNTRLDALLSQEK